MYLEELSFEELKMNLNPGGDTGGGAAGQGEGEDGEAGDD